MTTITLNTYTLGDQTRIVASFVDDEGLPINPTEVTGKIRTPDLEEADLVMTSPSVGTWESIYTVTQNGLHAYRIAGTGALNAAAEGEFMGQGMFEEDGND